MGAPLPVPFSNASSHHSLTIFVMVIVRLCCLLKLIGIMMSIICEFDISTDTISVSSFNQKFG